jgi:hypothetical protein
MFETQSSPQGFVRNWNSGGALQGRGAVTRWRVRSAAAVGAGLIALAVGACGSSGPGSGSESASNSSDASSAATLLKQTFAGTHKLNSGVLDMTATITPHGSSLLDGKIVLSASGPFQSEGKDKLGDTDLTLSIQAEGEQASMQVISTGGKGYVELGGTTYALPASSIQQIESQMSSAAGSGSAQSSANGELAKLGINPLSWISTGATVVGQAQVGGTETTHIHSSVDTAAVLHDFNRLLGETGKLGLGGSGGATVPSSIPAATQSKIVKALGGPSLDVWIGTADQTVRKLTVSATVPVTGSASKQLDGLTSADIALSFQLSDVNQPQTIQTPANPQPYSALQSQLGSLLSTITQGLSGTGLTGTGTSTTGTSTSALSATDQRYSQCIIAAKGDVTKMQACTKLLTGG